MKILRRIIGRIFHLAICNIVRLSPINGRVLMLHWVGEEDLSEELQQFCISTEQFQEILEYLKDKNTIHLVNWECEKDFYALTVDDVPKSFYYNAYPLLVKAGIPFTIFVNISLLDNEGYISSQQLIEMANCELCTIGSHGVSHGEFALLNNDQAIQDLLESKRILEKIIGKEVNMYAYPYGSYYACGYTNKHLTSKVYKYAFSTLACPITKSVFIKKYFLPRINVESINSI